MPQVERVAVLVNPIAGRGRGSRAGDAAAARLCELGVETRVLSGASADDTRRLAAEAIVWGPDAVVLVGGDGTIAAALDEFVGSDVPLVIVSAGTGNDFARALGLPRDAAQAAELVFSGSERAVDVGIVQCPDGDSRFVTVAALGFDALVSERTNRLRWPRGAARYYLALLIELARLRPIPFSLSINGGPPMLLPGILIAAGNTRSYGGGMPMCPGADPSDGSLELTHIAPIGRLKLLRLFPLLLRARHLQRGEVTSMPVSSLEIAAPGLVVYADGERIGTGPVRLGVLPGALRVRVPPSE